jgi:ribosome-associated toxin RatA of RatAB toxin-antitoxin module
MRHVKICATLTEMDSPDAYNTLRDFDNFVRLSEADREVKTTTDPDGRVESHWEVNFRDGILKWSESDEFDDRNLRIVFTGIGGDFEHLSGEWRVADEDGSTVVEFVARFDMGIASLRHIIEPVAERALIENVQRIVQGMFDDARIEPTAPTPRGST